MDLKHLSYLKGINLSKNYKMVIMISLQQKHYSLNILQIFYIIRLKENQMKMFLILLINLLYRKGQMRTIMLFNLYLDLDIVIILQ